LFLDDEERIEMKKGVHHLRECYSEAIEIEERKYSKFKM
jgi:hypothetical protein